MSVTDILRAIYGAEAVSGLKVEIGRLKKKYKIQDTGWQLSEKDVVLISYGDQVSASQGSKLKALHRFLQQTAQEAFSLVHILPFYPYSSDDGFSVIDYYAVNPDMGHWEDIRDLSATHRIMFDAVINHNSSESEWFRGYLSGDPAFEDYYISVEDPAQFDTAVRPRTSPLFHHYGTGPEHIWTTFSKDQVDLNFRNPKVLLQILDLLLFYISQGAQLIRLDAIGFMWKEAQTSCIHLPQTHQIIKLFRQVIQEVAPSVRLITETNVPHPENISYFGKGDEAHMVYNFTLPPLLAYSLLKGDVTKLTSWARTIEPEHPNTCFFNFLASHDGVGLRGVQGILEPGEVDLLLQSAEANGGKVSYRSTKDEGPQAYEINCNYLSLLRGAPSDEEGGTRKMILAHALLLTMPGLPAIYFHSFIGATNDLAGMERTQHNRSINRQKFHEKELEAMLSEPGHSREVYQTLLHLLDLRKQHTVFHPFATASFDQLSSSLMLICRQHENQRLSAYFNFADQPVEVPLDHTPFNLTESRREEGTLVLPVKGFAWLLDD